jgi:hypothetical protein
MKLLKSLQILSVLVVATFLVLVITDLKRFVVWSQITSHYQYMYDDHPEVFCTFIIEQRFRTNNNFLKITKANMNQQDFEDCYKSVEAEKKARKEIEDNIKPEDVTKWSVFAALSHKVRLSIFYPLVKVSSTYGINLHLVFTLFCLALIFMYSYILNLFFKENRHKTFFITLAGFTTLSLLMNGRMIIAFFSIGLLIWLMNYSDLYLKKFKNILIHCTILFLLFVLSNVSSGVNFVILFIYLGFAFIKLRKAPTNFVFWFFATACVAFQSIWVLSGVTKNLMFYGNSPMGIINMLDHGAGKNINSPIGLAVLVILGVIGVYMFKKLKHIILDVNNLGLIFFIIGGLYGYSVLACSIPFVYITMVRFINYKTQNLKLLT